MASTEAAIGRDLRRLFDGGATAGLTDAQLLDRVARGSVTAEVAFEAILTRHGPAVLACCRRVLGGSAAADDAFQATFLILFRRAGSIRVEASLAPWLLHVARLAALKARQGELRRRAREGRVPRPEALAPEDDASDLHLLVRTEVDRLPEKYRDPVRLCYFEGRTHDDAAAALGWPVGTVRGRLSRAREMLRTRLERRGIGIAPMALAAALAAGREARADVSQVLREATLAATARGGAIKAGVAALVAAVARGLAVATAFKTVAIILAVVSLISAGAGLAALAGRSDDPRPPQPDVKAEARARNPAVDRYGDPLPDGAVARLGTIRFRHSLLDSGPYLKRVRFSSDGRLLVTVGGRAGVSLWEARSGRLIRSIDATEAAISPDGKTLFVAGSGSLRAVDAASGLVRHRLPTGPGRQLNHLTIAPDGTSLAAVMVPATTDDNRPPPTPAIVIYDTATFAARRRIEGDYRHTRDLAFSPNGRALALARPDVEPPLGMTEVREASVRVYDVATGSETWRFPVDGFNIASVAFAPDGKTLAAGVGDRTIRLYDLATGRERLPRLNREHATPAPRLGEIVSRGYDEGARAMGAVAFSPDGSLLASGLEAIGYWNGRGTELVPVVVWDVAGRREVRRFAGHTSGIWSAAFAPDGRTLATAGSDPVARIWDVATGREVDPRPGHRGEYTDLAISPADGTVFTGGSWDHLVLRWDPLTGRCLGTVAELPAGIVAMDVAPDGKSLLVDTWDGLILWDVAARREIRRFTDKRLAHTGFYQASFSPDSRMVTMELRVWEAATGRLLTSFHDIKGDWPTRPTYMSARFAPDGRRLIVFETRGVRIFDIARGAEAGRPIQTEIPDPTRGVVSPDGRLVTAGNYKGLPPSREADLPIRIRELASGREVATLEGCTDQVIALAFSPDGRTLATAGCAFWHPADRTVRIWDVATGRELRRFDNRPGGATSVAYLPDSRLIVTACEDGTALVWDISELADRRPAEPPDAETFQALWSDLASDDARKAYRASWALSVPGAVPFLRDRLHPAAANEPTVGPEVLRTLRAIAALERIGSPPARDILEILAKGDAGAPATRDAAEALLRPSRKKTHRPGDATGR
jgi:RNA polymerase sigma factor (sigma-70 family)